MATGEFLTFENADRKIYMLRSSSSILLYEDQLTVSCKYLHLILTFNIALFLSLCFTKRFKNINLVT